MSDIPVWESISMKKVLLIVGSMREKPFNRQAALMAQKMLEKKADVSILSYEDLPQMNQDIEFPAPGSGTCP